MQIHPFIAVGGWSKSIVGCVLCVVMLLVAGVAGATDELPFERRVCRLYMGFLRPMGGNPPQPRKPLYGHSPEALADLLADIGTEVLSTDSSWGKHGAFWPSEMVPQNSDVPLDYLPRLVKRAHERGMWVLACEQPSEPENQAVGVDMNEWALHPIAGDHNVQPNKRWLSFTSPYRDVSGRALPRDGPGRFLV